VSSSDEAFSNRVGANARLRKPINVHQLRAVVRAQLSRSIRWPSGSGVAL
jgi:hypothetical protein